MKLIVKYFFFKIKLFHQSSLYTFFCQYFFVVFKCTYKIKLEIEYEEEFVFSKSCSLNEIVVLDTVCKVHHQLACFRRFDLNYLKVILLPPLPPPAPPSCRSCHSYRPLLGPLTSCLNFNLKIPLVPTLPIPIYFLSPRSVLTSLM